MDRLRPQVLDAQFLTDLQGALGAGGRAMFADAYAIVSCWWNVPALNAPVWQARRRALGHAGRDELRVAPLVFYPEAVHLARALAARERRRLRHTLTPDQDHAWLERVALLLHEWGIPAEGLDVVGIWASQHPLLSRPRRTRQTGTTAERPARGRHRRLPLTAPHTEQTLEATLGERSCLPWKLGQMITTELLPAPGSWTLRGRA
ncbi:TniQ protein OS=Streptomyces aurantiogriseus OX=66870 GN=GCM10010251_76210 PE=4 SV=1 [Streptomyces aurantiogriseus]